MILSLKNSLFFQKKYVIIRLYHAIFGVLHIFHERNFTNMINDESNFYITAIDSVTLIEEKIYPKKHVQYNSTLFTHELIFHSAGNSTFIIDNESFTITPNSILFIPQKKYNNYFAEFNQPESFIDIFFFSNIPFNESPLLFDTSANPKIEAYFKQILYVWTQKNSGFRSKCISLIWQILYELQRKDYVPHSQYKKLEPAVIYLEKNFKNPHISVENLAKMCDISYCYFQQLFSKKYGVTPIKYIVSLKINYSCDLLNKTSYNISEIAELSGFSDVYFFSRQFKKYIGISPKEYRTRLLENKSRFSFVKNVEKTE